MTLIPPRRLFDVINMKTVLYKNVADDVKERGYMCISHVWGDRQMYTANILDILGGVTWLIPLSDPDKFGRMIGAVKYLGGKYMWLDVVCMPQDRQHEIDEEVPFMGDYYAGASMTLALSDARYEMSQGFMKWLVMMDDVAKRGAFTEKETNWIYSHDDVDLLDVSQEIWFTRLWTIQEAALSKELVLVDNRGNLIPLYNMLEKVLYMTNVNRFYIYHVFKKSWKHLLALCDVMRVHVEGNFSIVNAWNERDCYRPQDRFYGMLGLLGYKDFSVDYDISMDDLNEKIVRHASSKGDITWLSIGGNSNKGFIQPIHKTYGRIGNNWTEDEPGTCGIVFKNDVLSMNVSAFGAVIHCKKFADYSNNREDFVAWAVCAFRDWGCSEDHIIRVVMGFVDGSDDIYGPAKLYIDGLVGDADHDALSSELVRLFGDKAQKRLIEITGNIAETDGRHSEQTIVVARSSETGENIPLIIYGNANIEDEIKLMRVHDELGRSLGIVCKSGKREGIFLYERVDVDKYIYGPYEFTL